MEKVIKSSIYVTILMVLLICFLVKPLGAGDIPEHEILVKVQPGIIGMIENPNIARVRIGSAAIRSTSLRELNKQYNAVSIEKVYQIVQPGKRGSSVGSLSSKGSSSSAPVDLSQIFTKSKKKQLEAQGIEVAQAPGLFLIQFDFSEIGGVDMRELVNAYNGIDVVIYAEHIKRAE